MMQGSVFYIPSPGNRRGTLTLSIISLFFHKIIRKLFPLALHSSYIRYPSFSSLVNCAIMRRKKGFFSVISRKEEDAETHRHKHAKLWEGESIHTEDHLLIHLCLLGNLGLESSTVSTLKQHYLLLFKVNNMAL